MKRLYLTLIACLLLVATVIMPVAAEDGGDTAPAPTPTGIDQNLIVHYDFEGETLEDQLKDKAPAGVSQENLTLVTTQDGEGADLSYVKDGVAHVDHNMNNYIWVNYNAENNIGTDMKNLETNGTMTVFTALKVIGAPQAWATFVDMNNVTRMLVQGTSGNNALFSDFRIRGGKTAYSGDNINWSPKNAAILHDIDVIYIAVTYEYIASTQKMVGTLYHSFDFGKTWTETPGAFENIEAFFSSNTYICLGKTRSGNAHVRFDHGSSYDFYDFRVYNEALTLDQIKTIKTGHEPADGGTVTPPVTNPPTPGVTNPPTPGVTNTQAPEITDAPTSGTNGDAAAPAKGGCSSGIATGGLAVLALASAAACAVGSKKKKK